MKAILVTAIASFLAFTVSAQTTTDTKATGTAAPAKLATGNKINTARPAKVANSTEPVHIGATSTTPAKDNTHDSNTAPATVPATGKKVAPAPADATSPRR